MTATPRVEGQLGFDTHKAAALDATSPQANTTPSPKVAAPADLLATDHHARISQRSSVGGDPLAPGQGCCDTHTQRAGGDPSAAAQADNETHTLAGGGDSLDPSQRPIVDDQWRFAGVDFSAAAQSCRDTQARVGGSNPLEPPVHTPSVTQQSGDGCLELRIWCEQLENAMDARIAATNRAERGGVDPAIYAVYLEALGAAEHVCELNMRRCYRRVAPPELLAWQKSERGIGDKLTARLLGHLGDPCIATPHHWEGTGDKRRLVAAEPYIRSISQLWQYCGVGDPHRVKRKGMTAEEAFALGNPTIKMLLRLHAESCVKAASGHYREVYDKARAFYDDKVHTVECVRCGPSGKPAQPGTPWAKGHQHGAALRKVAKEILRDMWRIRHDAISPTTTDASSPKCAASSGISLPTGHSPSDNQERRAGGDDSSEVVS